MGHIKVYLDNLEQLIENLQNAAHNTDVYANNLRNDNINTLRNIEGGCTEHITDAIDSINAKADSMNGTNLSTSNLVDRMGAFRTSLITFKNNVESVDSSVKNQLVTYGNNYRSENNIQTTWWEDLKYSFLDGIHSIMNDKGLGRVVSELCRNVKDWFTDRWEDIKEWYAFDGGEFICNIALAGLAIVASVFTILTAGVGFLAVVAIVASACAIVDAVAKIFANVGALVNNNSDPAWARKIGKATSLSTLGDTLVGHDADSGWGKAGKVFQVLGSINDVVSTICAVIQFTDFATKSIDKFTGKTSVFQKYLGSGGVFDSAFIEANQNKFRTLQDGIWYQLDEYGNIKQDGLGNKIKVDFSSRNQYSDGAEWKIRKKVDDNKYSSLLEGARDRFKVIGKTIKEDFGNVKGNVVTDMDKIKSYCISFKNADFKGNAMKILKDTGTSLKTAKDNYFRDDKTFFDKVKNVVKLQISSVSSYKKAAEKSSYMRGQQHTFTKILGKVSYVGTQINNGVTTATQALNVITGHFSDNWDTTAKWNKMIKGIDTINDRTNKTLDTYTISASTRYDNLNYLFN